MKRARPKEGQEIGTTGLIHVALASLPLSVMFYDGVNLKDGIMTMPIQ